MVYEVTATRKRPQTFDELIGQEFVVATLRNSIKQDRIAHAYLFSGPRGVGKTSAARLLAKALNCERGPTDSPCGACPACKEISIGNALDVIEIDGASNTSVNDVREIKDEVLFAPNSCRYKVYIIDEVHMLSNSAFNALLKTIEEPPPYIVFIFATTEVHKVPATIRSRCQQFNFRLLAPKQIKDKLEEAARELKISVEEQALFWIAKEATGSMRDAYTLLDQVASFSRDGITLEKIREKLGIVGIEEINNIGEMLIKGDLKETLEYTAVILDKGISVDQFVIDLTEYFRNLLFVKSGVSKESLLSFIPDHFPDKVLDFFSPERIEKAIELLLELYRNLKFSLNQRFELELLMSRLTGLKELISPAEILEALENFKKDLRFPPRPGPVFQRLSEASKQDPEGSEEQVKPEEGETAVDSQYLDLLIEAVKREKPALSASLGKADSFSLSADELTLSFQPGDRFSVEHVLKDREIVLTYARKISQTHSRQGPASLRVDFLEPESPNGNSTDKQVEMVKKLFRGDIVKGE